MPEFIEKISILHVIIALAVIAIIAVLILILPNAAYIKKKDDETSLNKPATIIGTFLLIFAIGVSIYSIVTINTAVNHGLYSMDLSFFELPYQIEHSPEDESSKFADYVEANGTPKNAIVVMYRFTCPDCEAVFNDLSVSLEALPYDHFWVSSRSPIGQQVRDAYDVEEVPSIITFDSNGRASVALAYTKDAAGQTTLDTSVMDIAERTLARSEAEVKAYDESHKTNTPPANTDATSTTTSATDATASSADSVAITDNTSAPNTQTSSDTSSSSTSNTNASTTPATGANAVQLPNDSASAAE